MFREMKAPFKGAIHFLNVAGIISLLVATGTIKHVFSIYGAITLQDLGYAAAGLVAVVGIFLALVKVAPWLNWSWTHVLNDGNESGIRSGENFTVATIRLRLIGPLYGVALFFCLPLLAHIEEQWFRGGTHGWEQGIPRSFLFGMIHCLVGVPLAAGLAIGVLGLWLTQNYFWGGVHQSTEVHAAYNSIIFIVAAVGLAVNWWVRRPRHQEAPAT